MWLPAASGPLSGNAAEWKALDTPGRFVGFLQLSFPSCIWGMGAAKKKRAKRRANM